MKKTIVGQLLNIERQQGTTRVGEPTPTNCQRPIRGGRTEREIRKTLPFYSSGDPRGNERTINIKIKPAEDVRIRQGTPYMV